MTRLPTMQELKQAAKENAAAAKLEIARLADEFSMSIRVKIIANAEMVVSGQPVFVQWSLPNKLMDGVLDTINLREPSYFVGLGEETQRVTINGEDEIMVAIYVKLR